MIKIVFNILIKWLIGGRMLNCREYKCWGLIDGGVVLVLILISWLILWIYWNFWDYFLKDEDRLDDF